MQLRGPHTIEVDGYEYPVNLAPGPCSYKRTDAKRTVYVITTGTEGPAMTKVGITRDVAQRLATIQSTSPVKLKLWWHREMSAVVADWVEMTAHEILRGRHTHHEWFRCSPSTACQAIELAMQHTGIVEHFYLDGKLRMSKRWADLVAGFPKEPLRSTPHRAPTVASLLRPSKMAAKALSPKVEPEPSRPDDLPDIIKSAREYADKLRHLTAPSEAG